MCEDDVTEEGKNAMGGRQNVRFHLDGGCALVKLEPERRGSVEGVGSQQVGARLNTAKVEWRLGKVGSASFMRGGRQIDHYGPRAR